MNSAIEKVFFQTSHSVKMQKALRVNKEMSMMNSSPPPGASIWQVTVVEGASVCSWNTVEGMRETWLRFFGYRLIRLQTSAIYHSTFLSPLCVAGAACLQADGRRGRGGGL
jgi:hypothetical protein